MNWIKSALFKLIARHALNAAGAWFVSKGFLTNDDTDKLAGAAAVLIAVGHSLWDKRAAIWAELKALCNGATPLLLALGLTLPFFCGCQHTQIVNASKGTGLDLDLPLGYNGANLFELRLNVGQFLTTTAVQPVDTNKIYSPSLSVASATDGSVTAPSLPASGTNAAAIAGGDKYNVNIGTANSVVTSVGGATASSQASQ